MAQTEPPESLSIRVRTQVFFYEILDFLRPRKKKGAFSRELGALDFSRNFVGGGPEMGGTLAGAKKWPKRSSWSHFRLGFGRRLFFKKFSNFCGPLQQGSFVGYQQLGGYSFMEFPWTVLLQVEAQKWGGP